MTKFLVSGRLDFDWEGEGEAEGEGEEDVSIWRLSLAQILVEKKGYKGFANRWIKWKQQEDLGGVSFGYSWFLSLLPRAVANALT